MALFTFHRELAFPEAKSFYDIFRKKTRRYKESTSKEWNASWEFMDHKFEYGPNRYRKEVMKITSFCSMRTAISNGGDSEWIPYINAMPKKPTVNYIKEHMLPGTGDSISFDIVFRSDGALIIAKNSSILAERWLALVETSTVPVYKDKL